MKELLYITFHLILLHQTTGQIGYPYCGYNSYGDYECSHYYNPFGRTDLPKEPHYSESFSWGDFTDVIKAAGGVIKATGGVVKDTLAAVGSAYSDEYHKMYDEITGKEDRTSKLRGQTVKSWKAEGGDGKNDAWTVHTVSSDRGPNNGKGFQWSTSVSGTFNRQLEKAADGTIIIRNPGKREKRDFLPIYPHYPHSPYLDDVMSGVGLPAVGRMFPDPVHYGGLSGPTVKSWKAEGGDGKNDRWTVHTVSSDRGPNNGKGFQWSTSVSRTFNRQLEKAADGTIILRNPRKKEKNLHHIM